MESFNPPISFQSSVQSFLRRLFDSRPLLILLIIGFLIRFIALILYLSTHDWKGEQWEYEMLAQNLLAGHGFVGERYNAPYYALVPPLFPFICYVLHLIGGTGPFYLVVFYTFHLGLALGIIWLSYRLALFWFGRSTATLAAWFVALEPGLIVYQSYKIDVITLSTFLLLIGLWFFQRLIRTGELTTAAALGVCIGLSLLTRLDLIILLGLVGAMFLSSHGVTPSPKALSVILAVSMLVITPWLIRNYVVLDRFVFIASTTGEWLWLGNNPNSVGTPVSLDGRGVLEAAPESFNRSINQASDEFQVNAIFMKEAVRYIAQDPWRYARHVAAKFWYFWWFTPTYGMNYYQHIGQAWKVGYKVLHAGILLLAAFGAWFAFHEARRESRHALLFILTPCILLAVIHGLTYVEGRHRIMAQPLLLILAAAGAWFLWTKFKPAPQDRVNV